MIEARDIVVRAPGWRRGRPGRTLLSGVSLTVRPGEVVAVVGPNGAGKSTLLRALAGEITPASGAVILGGRTLRETPPLALARRRAVVSQRVGLAFPMTAEEVVRLGRIPWHGTPEAARDDGAVGEALERAGVAHLAGQSYATLSGGEAQRVQVARALAQLDGAPPPAALLLDEPTASLDAGHRGALLRSLRGLAADGLAVLAVLHDLNEAAFVADRVVVVADGRLHVLGTPAEVLTAEGMGRVYGTAFRAVAGGGLLPEYGAA